MEIGISQNTPLIGGQDRDKVIVIHREYLILMLIIINNRLINQRWNTLREEVQLTIKIIFFFTGGVPKNKKVNRSKRGTRGRRWVRSKKKVGLKGFGLFI